MLRKGAYAKERRHTPPLMVWPPEPTERQHCSIPVFAGVTSFYGITGYLVGASAAHAHVVRRQLASLGRQTTRKCSGKIVTESETRCIVLCISTRTRHRSMFNIVRSTPGFSRTDTRPTTSVSAQPGRGALSLSCPQPWLHAPPRGPQPWLYLAPRCQQP